MIGFKVRFRAILACHAITPEVLEMKLNRSINLTRLLSAPLAYWIGCFYYQRGRWARSGRWLETSIKRKPSHAPSHFQRGMVDFKRERWEEAYRYMHEAISLDPDQTSWMVQFCQAARNLGCGNSTAVDLCTKRIEQRIAADRGNPVLLGELARIYRIQNRTWLEIDTLNDAIQLDPRDANLKTRLGQALERMKRYGEAAEAYGSASDLNPNNRNVLYKTGLCIELSGTSDADAIARMKRCYSKAIANSRGDAQIHGVGVLHQDGGHWRLAANAYHEQLSSLRGDAALLRKLGLCHDRLYEWAKAAEYYGASLAVEPQQPEIQMRLGFVQERLGDFEKAAASYQLGAPDPEAGYFHARALDTAGRHREACEAYAGLEPAPSTQAPGQTNPAFTSKTPRRSLEQLKSILAKDARDGAVWFELALRHEQQGDWRAVAEAARQAADRFPDHQPAIHHLLGRSLMHLERHEEACEAFRNIRIFQRNHGVPVDPFKKKPKLWKQACYLEYLETLPLRGKSVFYESFHGSMISCSPYALCLHMMGCDDYLDWTHIWSVDDDAVIPADLKSLPNVVFVRRDSDTYLRHLASAALLVNNTTFPSWFMRREGQLYLNTWHGTPWKTLGKHVANELLAHGNVSRNFLHCTHIATPNPYTSDILVRSYDIGGVYTGSIMDTGSPRVDITLNLPETRKQELRSRLGVPEGRKIVLFAPTWRGTLGAARHEVSLTEAVIGRLARLDGHLLFRGHYFVEDSLGRGASSGTLVPPDITTNELLAIVDVLITDYSSVFFDFIPTGKPVLFYLNDFEEYQRERGLYFGIEELPGEVVRNVDELCTALSRHLADRAPSPHPRHGEALAKFAALEDGNASQRVLEFVFSGNSRPLPADNRRKILMFGGHFALNGITIALINLLNNLDHSKFRLVLTVDTGAMSLLSESKAYFKALHEEVQVFPRVGSLNSCAEEHSVLGVFNKTFRIPESPEAFGVFCRAHEREFRRMFGNASFHSTIDYSGYNGVFSALIGCAERGQTGFRSIYQHNEMHGEWKTKYPTLERVFSVYHLFDRLVSVSRGAMVLNRKHLASEFGIPESKFDFADNLVNEREVLSRAEEPLAPEEERALFPPGTKVFLSIGRLSVEKDHQKLIRAFQLASRSRPELRLVIIGEGPLAATLAMLVDELKLKDRVDLIGYRLNPFPYLKRADCFVFSSNYEGQGLVLLEAMILHKPIVSVDIEVCRGVLENRSGILVENSIEGLVSGMEAYLGGKVPVRKVNFEEYRANALHMFYEKACGIDPALETNHAVSGEGREALTPGKTNNHESLLVTCRDAQDGFDVDPI